MSDHIIIVSFNIIYKCILLNYIKDIQEENNPFNPESILKTVDDIIEYSVGTNIYFGSTVALQVIILS